MNNSKKKCPVLTDEFEFFDDLFLNIRMRRVLFEEFEKILVNKKVNADFPGSNDFARMIERGYLVQQLLDLRKIFLKNEDEYSFRFITRHLSEDFKKEHKKLYDKWNLTLEKVTNKIFCHSEKSFDIIKNVQRKELDSFIGECVELFEKMINALGKKYSGISSSYLYDNDKDYLKSIGKDVENFFCQLS